LKLNKHIEIIRDLNNRKLVQQNNQSFRFTSFKIISSKGNDVVITWFIVEKIRRHTLYRSYQKIYLNVFIYKKQGINKFQKKHIQGNLHL